MNDNETIHLSEIINNLLLKYKGKYIKGQFIKCGDGICIKFDINKQIYNTEISGGYDNYVQLVYKCNDTLHSNFPKNIFSGIAISTKDFTINHTSSIPLSSDDCNNFDSHFNCKHSAYGEIHDNETLELSISVSSIVYEEKKGISKIFDKIMNKTNKYPISYIENDMTYSDYQPDLPIYDEPYEDEEEQESLVEEDGVKEGEEEGEEEEEEEEEEWEKTIYKHLAIFSTYPVGKYQIYRRSEISFLTVLANIGALFSTFYSVFSFVFIFYSKNFDNYKIVEKILQLELTNNSKNKMQKKINFQNQNIELNELKFEKDNIISPLVDSFTDSDIDKEENNENKTDLANKLIEEKKEDKNLKNEENDDINIIIENGKKILPKLSFFDFYFNNFYFKCCKRRKKQDILALCNSIKFKYISIDSILYDLIRLENLFKDYKWNNSELNSLENNELIKKLIKLI